MCTWGRAESHPQATRSRSVGCSLRCRLTRGRVGRFRLKLEGVPFCETGRPPHSPPWWPSLCHILNIKSAPSPPRNGCAQSRALPVGKVRHSGAEVTGSRCCSSCEEQRRSDCLRSRDKVRGRSRTRAPPATQASPRCATVSPVGSGVSRRLSCDVGLL